MVKVFYNDSHKKCRIVDQMGKEWLADAVLLKDAVFVVDKNLRREYLKTNVRNNHSWIEGTYVSAGIESKEMERKWIHARYYREKGYFTPTAKCAGEEDWQITKASEVLILRCEIYIKQ